jgi:hypothetical protein
MRKTEPYAESPFRIETKFRNPGGLPVPRRPRRTSSAVVGFIRYAIPIGDWPANASRHCQPFQGFDTVRDNSAVSPVMAQIHRLDNRNRAKRGRFLQIDLDPPQMSARCQTADRFSAYHRCPGDDP